MTSVREIAEMLVVRCEDAARDLLPSGRRSSGEWACSGSNSPVGYAISVCLRGKKRGTVGFWGSNARGKCGGDILDLAEEIFRSKRLAVEWAKGFLGISDDRPEQTEAQKKAAEKRRKERERQDAQRAQRKQTRAQEIWRGARPIKGTLAERYLIGRGLSPSDWPVSLRAHESLEWELGRVRDASGSWAPGPFLPALVAAVQNVERHVVAVWRIYLDECGNKAQVDPCKVGLGPARGGAVRFGPAMETIGVAEGIETSLALREIIGDAFPIWATLSTSGMAALELPPSVREVRIFADSDLPHKNHRTGEEGEPPGLRAATALAARLNGRGVAAIIEPLPDFKTDFLDIVAKNNAEAKG